MINNEPQSKSPHPKSPAAKVTVVKATKPRLLADDTIKAKDFALMTRIQGGDMVAFNDMVNNYKDRLMKVIGRMLSSVEEAEDVIQETFVRVYQHRMSFDFKHCFSTWIYTIALNLARNELRKRKRFKFLDIFEMQGKEPELSVEMKIPTGLSQVLEREIRSLPEKYRTAFMLRDVDEQPYDEIARILSVPLGTVKSRVNRARAILRDRLRPRVEEKNALSKATLLPASIL